VTSARPAGRIWRRIAGMLLFDGSLVAATLGIARWIFGVAIELPPGLVVPLGSGGPWPPLALAVVLFVAGASIAPVRRSAESPGDRALRDDAAATSGGILEPGRADIGASASPPTPMPRHREGH
jgi:hypothetical protein